MNYYECGACGGVYRDMDEAGSPYYHVCALVANPGYQPDVRKGAFDPREMIPRDGHRDENLKAEVHQGVTAIKSEGKGRRVIPVSFAGGVK